MKRSSSSGWWAAALLALAVGSTVPAPRAAAEDPPAPPPPGSPERRVWREQTWPAPTAEDWKKPVQITWQRTWEDALAVAKETGKPILVCINMDGEIASEHYAGVRYRQPEIGALYEPYVTVIASVYRHNPRDFDDDGHRIPCPRFGGVTCGEHIAIEPVIFEKFCDGERIAPRHIMVELDAQGVPSKEVYDVFYRNDVVSVLEDVRKGIAERTATPRPVVRSDRPLVERVASREATDRSAVEKAYAAASPEQRKALLEAALAHPESAPLDLLRLAVFGLDPDLSRLAREALAKVETPDATTLVADALRVPMDAKERDALIGTLKRLGASSPLARWLSVVHQGLAVRSVEVDASRWDGAAGGTYAPEPTVDVKDSDLPTLVERRAQEASERPDDPEARLALAEASLALVFEAPTVYADSPTLAKRLPRMLLADARRAAEEAERLGAKGWRVDAVAVLSAYYAGDLESAFARAETAVKEVPPGDGTWASMAVLTVFSEGRWRQIKKAVKEKLDFPPQWLADVNAAYSVLRKHPLGNDDQVLWHYDLLDWLGATAPAQRVMEEGIARFPDSGRLHERMRKDLLRLRGPEALEAAYDALRAKAPSKSLSWFAGHASVSAAGAARNALRYEAALAAYARAQERFNELVDTSPEAAHAAIALVQAGIARVLLVMNQPDAALSAILASFAADPGSAGTKDEMGFTPGDTAQSIRARLLESGDEVGVKRLDEALANIDPDLLRPDGE